MVFSPHQNNEMPAIQREGYVADHLSDQVSKTLLRIKAIKGESNSDVCDGLVRRLK